MRQKYLKKRLITSAQIHMHATPMQPHLENCEHSCFMHTLIFKEDLMLILMQQKAI